MRTRGAASRALGPAGRTLPAAECLRGPKILRPLGDPLVVFLNEVAAVFVCAHFEVAPVLIENRLGFRPRREVCAIEGTSAALYFEGELSHATPLPSSSG